jgi:hypothetical protein
MMQLLLQNVSTKFTTLRMHSKLALPIKWLRKLLEAKLLRPLSLQQKVQQQDFVVGQFIYFSNLLGGNIEVEEDLWEPELTERNG